ncbi:MULTISPECIES: SRPBCC family protein [Tsukamurella]|uniref:SRPBCC family protein n=1 Tax=Tsukamurella strandjordii TaxID=147577 RepID=A0AA90S7B4_9ACTN|nr:MULTISPECIES: SRPBCC family protein [Tsukamurella]MDP0397010.1 SRPBCC family protein [Tsukamurella strandjordii]GIZ96811.1 hypothetical protein TTY48_14230 [Tsukamurella sp. TY48]
MPALKPVLPADLTPGNPGVYEFSVRSARPVEWVWGELTSDTPLHWCNGIRKIEWTSPRPFAAGSTRTVTLGPGISADEIFYSWEESEDLCEKAFYVQSATAPGLSRLAEKYRVEALPEGGSLFTWTLLIEPVGGAKVIGLSGLPVGLVVKWLQRDTEKYLGSA